MGDFSIGDVVFTGFRFVRENLRVVAIWAVITFILSMVGGLAMVSLFGPVLTQMMAMRGQPDPAQAMAMMRQLGPFYLAMIPLVLVFHAILFGMINRAVLEPENVGFAYLRLGGDELRQGLLYLLVAVFAIAVYIGFIVVVVVVVLLAMFGLGQGAMGWAIAAVVIAGLCGGTFLSVRLSLASALTFDRRKVDLFGSWALTRGRFWKLFGCYLLVGLLAMAMMLLILIIEFALAAIIGGGLGGAITQVFRPDMSSVGAYFTPARLIMAAVGAVTGPLLYPVAFMPQAEIYRRLRAKP